MVSTTGSETDDYGELVDVSGLVGEIVEVEGACPTSRRDGWLIAVEQRNDAGDVGPVSCWFAEDSLKRAGPRPTRQQRGRSIWQDNVNLKLVTDVIWDDPGEDEHRRREVTEEDKEVKRIATSAVAVLRALVEARQVLWFSVVSQDDPIEIIIHRLTPSGDLLAAYQRIVSAPTRAWMHGEDSRGFPMSAWERPLRERTDFLVPGIESAKVTCKHWSTPARLVERSRPRRKRVPRGSRAGS